MSRTIISGIVTFISGLLIMVNATWDIGPYVEPITSIIVQLAGLATIYFRYVATENLRNKEPLVPTVKETPVA